MTFRISVALKFEYDYSDYVLLSNDVGERQRVSYSLCTSPLKDTLERGGRAERKANGKQGREIYPSNEEGQRERKRHSFFLVKYHIEEPFHQRLSRTKRNVGDRY